MEVGTANVYMPLPRADRSLWIWITTDHVKDVTAVGGLEHVPSSSVLSQYGTAELPSVPYYSALLATAELPYRLSI